MKGHPLAAAIPEMTPDEYRELVADVRAHGLRYPIVTFEGMVLDGRHRLRACEEIGVEPVLQEFAGSTAQAEIAVLSLNVHRRHLTETQRRILIREELRRDPTQSDMAIAKKVGVSDSTVLRVRHGKHKSDSSPEESDAADAIRRREWLAKVKEELARDPSQTDTLIGAKAGVSKSTVRRVRVGGRYGKRGGVVPPPVKEESRYVRDRLNPLTQRVDEIRELLNSGSNLDQIARKLKTSRHYVSLLCHRNNIKVPLASRPRPINFNRLVEETVNSLVGMAAGLRLLPKDFTMPQQEAAELVKEAGEALAVIHRVVKQLKGIAHG